jgi:hypothetical protein
MGNRRTITAASTALASLGTLLFLAVSFSINAAQYSPSWLTRHVSGTSAFFGWLEFVVLMFGWTSVACMYMRKRYWLAVTGAILVWLSVMIEFFSITIFSLLNPISSGFVSCTPPFLILVLFPQFLFSSIGLFFTITSKNKFVS